MSREQLTPSLAIEAPALHHFSTKPLPTDARTRLQLARRRYLTTMRVPLSSFSNHTHYKLCQLRRARAPARQGQTRVSQCHREVRRHRLSMGRVLSYYSCRRPACRSAI